MKINLEIIWNTYTEYRARFDDLYFTLNDKKFNFKELGSDEQLQVVWDAINHTDGVEGFLKEAEAEGEACCAHDVAAHDFSSTYHRQ